ncbi:MAG TPA: TROVE domain-containing protein, partial [Candidatus Ozemobacteraceae bacterium]|nr:TROVE domain-containing protein [Candidatus Ozemobacteraceae bacterium]
MLDSLGLSTSEWANIARQSPWHALRMNLNTFLRHGVFADSELVAFVARRLRDRDDIHRNRVFPYQLLAAYRNVNVEMPGEIKDALQDAMEIAISRVPAEVDPCAPSCVVQS